MKRERGVFTRLGHTSGGAGRVSRNFARMAKPAAPLISTPMAALIPWCARTLLTAIRHINCIYFFLLIFLLGVSTAIAQDVKRAVAAYPQRPVRLVVPFPPGGGNDTSTRAIAMQFSTSLGQPFVIDNRAGAGGAVGAEIVANPRGQV